MNGESEVNGESELEKKVMVAVRLTQGGGESELERKNWEKKLRSCNPNNYREVEKKGLGIIILINHKCTIVKFINHQLYYFYLSHKNDVY